MKIEILDAEKKKTGEKEMPSQFSETYRPDLIKRAVHALQSAARQAYGAHPEAGQRHSSELSKRRRKYRGCYGFGISAIPDYTDKECKHQRYSYFFFHRITFHY